MSKEDIFTPEDLALLEARGISPEAAEKQVQDMRQGFPYLDIAASASLERGIVQLSEEEKASYMKTWQDYLSSGKASVCKMVPASGAASRMFKSLFTFLNGSSPTPDTPEVERFFSELPKFAFYDRLSEVCLRNEWKSVGKLIAQGEYRVVLENLLLEKGLNYGSLPKGLIQFHSYPKGSSTSSDEHLVEGALYGRDITGLVRVHYTVSPEHRSAFETQIDSSRPFYEDKYGVRYSVTFSEQKASTDTLALQPDGSLFRRDDGSLLFRPGGHGSLICNLGEIEADIVFIKNIDNVVPDHLRSETIIYKKCLAGVLLALRDRIYGYLYALESGKTSRALVEEMCEFVSQTLCIKVPETLSYEDKTLHEWLSGKLNRPIRVCGMVRNQGEPGGGPFLINEPDGSTSLQILESSQINMADDSQRALFERGQYFNPVDIVCSLRDHHGNPFDLEKFVNPRTAFIASKSMGGRELIALERPGLWNGAMHHWTTLFVEVPVETFNPVKEVNDLLRWEHQGPLRK